MSKWPESAVAVALILLIAAVSVTGIARYPVEEFLKIWAALTGLVGIITAQSSLTFSRARLSIMPKENWKTHKENSKPSSANTLAPYWLEKSHRATLKNASRKRLRKTKQLRTGSATATDG
jgi:hypothetical protein